MGRKKPMHQKNRESSHREPQCCCHHHHLASPEGHIRRLDQAVTQTKEFPQELKDILEHHDALINKEYKLCKLPAEQNVAEIIVGFLVDEEQPKWKKAKDAFPLSADHLKVIRSNLLNAQKTHILFDAAHNQNIFHTFVLHDKEIEQYRQTVPNVPKDRQNKDDDLYPSCFYGLPHLLRFIQAREPIQNLDHLIDYLVRKKDDLFNVERDYESTVAFEEPGTSA